MGRVRSNRVCFTLNNYDFVDVAFIEQYLQNTKNLRYGVAGLETASTGTNHIQGFIHLDADPKKCGIKFWKKELQFTQDAHFENAMGTDEQNQKYCIKDGLYIEEGEPRTDSNKYKEIYEAAKTNVEDAIAMDYEFGLKHYYQLHQIFKDNNKENMKAQLVQLRDWQKEAVEKLENQKDRGILFVVDEKGGKGKSALARHLLTTKNSWGCQGGKINDLMHTYKRDAEFVIFDMARCNNPDFFPWNFMENLKNGWFMSTKYHGGMQIFTPPKIIVFMNQCPPKEKLSYDRYELLEI